MNRAKFAGVLKIAAMNENAIMMMKKKKKKTGLVKEW